MPLHGSKEPECRPVTQRAVFPQRLAPPRRADLADEPFPFLRSCSMDVHTLVSQLGDRTGTPLALDEDGILTLMFENDVEVTMEYDDELNVLQLYAVIGEDPLDDDIRLTLYGTLLEANMAAGHLRRHPGAGRRERRTAADARDRPGRGGPGPSGQRHGSHGRNRAQWRDILMRRCRTKARKRTANPTPWPERKRRERRG